MHVFALSPHLDIIQCSITVGSATLTSVSADLTSSLASGDQIQLYSSAQRTRNFTVSSVASNTVVSLSRWGWLQHHPCLYADAKSVKYALENANNHECNGHYDIGWWALATSTACAGGSGTYIDKDSKKFRGSTTTYNDCNSTC